MKSFPPLQTITVPFTDDNSGLLLTHRLQQIFRLVLWRVLAELQLLNYLMSHKKNISRSGKQVG